MTTLCLDDLNLKIDVVKDEPLTLNKEILPEQVVAITKKDLLKETKGDIRWQKAS